MHNFEQQKFYISELELALEQKNQDILYKLINKIHIADLASLLSDYNSEKRIDFVNLVQDNFPAELFFKFNEAVSNDFINIIGAEKVAYIIKKLEFSTILDIFENLEEHICAEILSFLPKSFKKNLEESLNFPLDSVARLMNNNFLSVPKHWTIKQVNDYCRQNKKLITENFYAVFVVDNNYTPIGIINTKSLIINKIDAIVLDIMEVDFVKFNYLTLEEEVALDFQKYNLNIAPIINNDNRMIGFVTIDNVVDLIDKIAEEDILHLGGINESDIYTRFSKTIKQRLPWLLVNLFTAVIASIVISIFDNTIKNLVALAVLMPIIASMGGNAGTQAVTVAVRSLATKELNNQNVTRIILKEALIGLVNGLFFAILSFLTIIIIYHNIKLALLFATATIITLTIAGISGTIIPVIIARLKGDPAISSGIILTTITDVIAFLAFLGFATIFI
jgi:magnesium transporter